MNFAPAGQNVRHGLRLPAKNRSFATLPARPTMCEKASGFAVVACYLPALRAMQLDPMTALGDE